MSQERMRKILTVAGIAATLALAGCADGLDDLRADIEKAKQRPGGRIKPLPEVRPYVSHEYQMADRRSPFLQSHHVVQPHVVGAQILSEQNPGEQHEQREYDHHRGCHVDQEVVEGQAGPAADDDVGRIPDECGGPTDVRRQHFRDQKRLGPDL